MTPMPWSESPRPILCYVTDRRALGFPHKDEAVAALAARIQLAQCAGVDCIQIREKDLDARALGDLVRAAVRMEPRCRILVNDRLDVALAAGAAGVHLGAESLPVTETVTWCREGHASEDFLVGRSCHSVEEAAGAERDGADYVFFGPVFATPSKAKYGAPQGIARLAEVCQRVGVPVLAIGGINLENAGECLAAGAAGVAAIRIFQETADISAIVARLRSL